MCSLDSFLTRLKMKNIPHAVKFFQFPIFRTEQQILEDFRRLSGTGINGVIAFSKLTKCSSPRRFYFPNFLFVGIWWLLLTYHHSLPQDPILSPSLKETPYYGPRSGPQAW